MWILLQYILAKLAFKDYLYGFFKTVIGRRVTEVLVFRIVLKIHYKSSSKYLVAEDIVRGVVKDSEIGLEAEPGVERPSNLFIS